MKKEDYMQQVIAALEEIGQDSTVPKNIKGKIEETIQVLKQDGAEESIKVNKALSLLDDVADDANIKSYTRTQIWNVVSLLEKI